MDIDKLGYFTYLYNRTAKQVLIFDMTDKNYGYLDDAAVIYEFDHCNLGLCVKPISQRDYWGNLLTLVSADEFDFEGLILEDILEAIIRC